MNVKGIPEEFLCCRDLSHAWDHYDAKIIPRTRAKASRGREIHQVLICTRCTTRKTRVLTPGGEILRHSYVYPQGYLLTQQGRISPADRGIIRSINVKRAMATQKEQEK